MKLLKDKEAFTLTELLVVIAIIAILGGVVASRSIQRQSQGAADTCMNNLRQINLGLRMYSDDAADKAPLSPHGTNGYNDFILDFVGYKKAMKNYVGLNGVSSPRDKLFACPADTFYYEFSATNTTYFAAEPCTTRLLTTTQATGSIQAHRLIPARTVPDCRSQHQLN